MKQIGILAVLLIVLILAGVYAWKKWQYYNPAPPPPPPAAEVLMVETITAV